MADKEGRTNSEMVVGKCNSAHVKRRKKKSTTNIESLPGELLFNILVNLSAEDIHNGAKLVCWKWYRMIHTRNFVRSHLHNSTPGLLIQNFDSQTSSFMALREGQVEVSNFSYAVGDGTWATCNGLIIEHDISKKSLLITNPAINKQFVVPKFYLPGPKYVYCPSIAYSAASKEYKVVQNYDLTDWESCVPRWYILTVGVDESWREICTQHLPNGITAEFPLITEGFIHWDAEGTHVLTLNIETEVITRTPVPQGYEDKTKHYLSTGKSLSMFVRCSDFCFEGWEMKSGTGEWTKVHNIDLEAQKSKFKHMYGKNNFRRLLLVPVCWLKYKEVLVFLVSLPTRECIVYDVLTKEISLFKLSFDGNLRDFRPHTNSLVWLD